MSLVHRYSDMVTNKKIVILGIEPPTFGGVSVHIQRVKDRLLDQGNTVFVFNIEQQLRRKWALAYLIKLFFWLLIKRPDTVHYHGTYQRGCWGDLFILRILKYVLRFEIIIIDHDCRHLYKRGWLFKRLYTWVLKHVDKLVPIGTKNLQSYEDNGFNTTGYEVEGSFLPPVVSMASAIEHLYPSSLFIFLKEYTPVILINASFLMRIDGKDIYGLDVSFDMIAQLKKNYPDVGLIMAIANIDNQNYFDLLIRKMRGLGVSEQVFILRGQKEIWPLFKKIDLFIRPTLSD